MKRLILLLPLLLVISCSGKDNNQAYIPPSPSSPTPTTSSVPGACPTGTKIVDGIIVWQAVTHDSLGNVLPSAPDGYVVICNEMISGNTAIADAGSATNKPMSGELSVGKWQCVIEAYGKALPTSAPSSTIYLEKTSAGLMCY